MAIQTKIERIIEAVDLAKKSLGLSSDSKLSLHYGLSRTAVNLWKTTGQINYKNIEKLSSDSGLNKDWIDEGKPPKQNKFEFSNKKEFESKYKENATYETDLNSLISVATPRTASHLQELKEAAESGKITEDELDELMAIARRIINNKND